MAKLIMLIVLLLLTATCFTGCQMMEGFGKDLQWTGESIQKTAE